MEIVCQYDKELEKFLVAIVEYTLNKYGAELNLQNLKQIELMHISEFDIEKDGSTYDNGTMIVVTSRLYDMLPNYNIKELVNNDNFKMLINTMYHEMGHVSDWIKYPKIYAEAETGQEMEKVLPSLFWLEFLAEVRSCNAEGSNVDEFCTQFVQRQWHSYKNDLSLIDESNFFYLNKLLPYFIARTKTDGGKKYLIEIKNSLLREYIDSLVEELDRLENNLPFDDVNMLENLYDIMNEYYKKFKSRFKPVFGRIF